MNNHPLDSRQLRSFVTIVRTGSFTVAARELFLSQSAVSHSLRALEEDVGCRLLDRMGKKVALTPGGEHLFHHAFGDVPKNHEGEQDNAPADIDDVFCDECDDAIL